MNPAQQETCQDFLGYAIRIASKIAGRNDIDSVGVAQLALCEAAAAHDPADPLPIKERVRRSVRDALRNERRAKFPSTLSPGAWGNLSDGESRLSVPAADAEISARDWIDATLEKLGDTADEALAHRVFVVGESVQDIATESKCHWRAMYRKVAGLRDRLAAIITDEKGEEVLCA